MSNNRKRTKFVVGGIVLLVLITLAIKYLPDIIDMMNYDSFKRMLDEHEDAASYIYFIISFLQPITLPVPEPVTVMAGSSVLGCFKGAVIGWCGTTLGIFTMFMISRFAGKKIMSKLLGGENLEKFHRYIEKNETLVILMLFIFPVLPDEVICAGAGLYGLNAYKFMIIAAIAKLITQFSLSYSVQLIQFNLRNCIILILVLAAIMLIKTKIQKRLAYREN